MSEISGHCKTKLFEFFSAASSLKCYKCSGTNTKPQCNVTEECGTGKTQCISSVEKNGDTVTYEQECAIPAACTTAETVCKAQKLINQLDDCAYECCDKDHCNKNFPSFSSGVQVTSGLVAIATTLAFALFII